MLYNFIRYSLIPFLIFYFKAEKNVAYGFADNKAFEKDFAKDFTIYESLPLSVLYKNYKLRQLAMGYAIEGGEYNKNTRIPNFYRKYICRK